jgi:hypothetical protein
MAARGESSSRRASNARGPDTRTTETAVAPDPRDAPPPPDESAKIVSSSSSPRPTSSSSAAAAGRPPPSIIAPADFELAIAIAVVVAVAVVRRCPAGGRRPRGETAYGRGGAIDGPPAAPGQAAATAAPPRDGVARRAGIIAADAMILRGGIIAAWRGASDGRSNINGAYGGHAARDLRAMILPATPFTLTTTIQYPLYLLSLSRYVLYYLHLLLINGM